MLDKKLASTLAEGIQRELDARDWNRSELARQAGLPHARISEIMAGKYDLRLGTLAKIAKAFCCPLTNLLTPVHDPARV